MLIETIKVEKYFFRLCLNLFFKFLPCQVVEDSPHPRKWKESYPTRYLAMLWVDQSLHTPATRENKFTKINPALIPGWNTKLPTVFLPYGQEPEKLKSLFHFNHKFVSDMSSRGLVQPTENFWKLQYFKLLFFFNISYFQP